MGTLRESQEVVYLSFEKWVIIDHLGVIVGVLGVFKATMTF